MQTILPYLMIYDLVILSHHWWFSILWVNHEKQHEFIGISQKNKYLLEPLIQIYGGRVDISSPKTEAFKYVIYRKAELINLIDNYFSKYPLRTEKM